MSALELKRALREKSLTSVDIVEALLARRRAVDGKLHAFVVDLSPSAKKAAARCDAERRAAERAGTLGALPPLHGLPITVKENVEIAGTASTLGVEKRRDAVATTDAVTVELARRAGAFVLGKTNVPQTLLSMESTNFLFGTTNNPWALDRTPGGSSGGEAAAIASGASVLGIGTDIGGSLRIPAAYTGLATIKSSLHRSRSTSKTWRQHGLRSRDRGRGRSHRVVADARGRFTSVDGQVATLQEMTAQDYADSDPLDLDHLSTIGGE